MTRSPARPAAALALILAAVGQLALAATHAHAVPRDPGLAPATDARTGQIPGGDDLDACAVCKGLVQRRDLLHRDAAPVPVASIVRSTRSPAAGSAPRSVALPGLADSRAPPSRS